MYLNYNIGVDSAVGFLRHMAVGNVTFVSEVYAASMCRFLLVTLPTSTGCRNPGVE
jgi:hypothetical protein